MNCKDLDIFPIWPTIVSYAALKNGESVVSSESIVLRAT